MLEAHLQRLEEGLADTYNMGTLSKWAQKYIRLENKHMDMRGAYSYQADVLDNTSRVVNTVKLAQIGLTTATMAYILSAMATQPRMNAIYALPSASDASKLVATKLNPLIYGSPELARLTEKSIDSVELKQIGANFLYIRGTRSETAALSISADALIVDELDRCDPEVVKQFRSRLQASPLQIVRQFSTPTIAGLGIDKEAKTSKRHRHMATCACCGHKWLPSYHTDIVVPGYYGDLSELTATNIKDVNWQGAAWMCPKCRLDPILSPSNLEWVCENPGDNYEATTYFISPATVCDVLKPPYFVRVSTEYSNRSEFYNQALGETSQEANEQITDVDVERALVPADLSSSDPHYLGIDVGLLCAMAVGRMKDGALIVVHREMCPLHKLEERRRELVAKYRIIATVIDAQPEMGLVMRMTEADPNVWGCGFREIPTLYSLQEKEADKSEGVLNLRLVKTNRTMLFDTLLDKFKRGAVLVAKTQETDNLNAHYTSLKRVRAMRKNEFVWAWDKTTGEDHQLFALGYLFLAASIRSGAGWTAAGAVPLIASFRLK